MSAIPERARNLVKERQMGFCARCGMPGAEMHHRQRRREAGHAVSILVWLCSKDHRWAHAHPVDAKKVGYIISPHHRDAASVPILTYAGWVTFDDLGGVAVFKENEGGRS